MVDMDPTKAKEFVEKYNLYLAAVEGITLETKLVPDDGSEDRP
jgi:hypothetical protein